MRLLIEVESADEFVELLQELRWQSRNGKLDDTLDGYKAAYAAITGTERERCAEICADRAEQWAAKAEERSADDSAWISVVSAEALECARRILGEK